MMKLFVLLLAAASALAMPVNRTTAEAVAAARMQRDGVSGDFTISACNDIGSTEGDAALAYAFDLLPTGYVIVTADSDLPPVIAYSYTNALTGPDQGFGMMDLVRLDLEARLACLDRTPQSIILSNRTLWEDLASGRYPVSPVIFEQWPPAGSTPTGGWLMENWTQSAPYNAYCPMDLIAGARSVAGCPAVAMGMILDNLETTNACRFDDTDDYYHNYHEYYWIDDDYVAHDFPSWTELNALLDVLDSHYLSGTPLTNSDKAALVFASGSACKQVYTASGSGTFGVDQAYDGYLRFGYSDCELLFDDSDSLFEKLSQNMIDTLPAHLAIVDAAWQYGHNVVVDGYNTDEFYHFNFGWGGSTNGWYSFPLTGMPYSMNLIEGIVLNIGVSQTSVEEEPWQGEGPITLSLGSNPVMSNPELVLGLAGNGHVTIAIYGMTGRLVAVLADEQLEAGAHVFSWDTGDAPSGVYLARAVAPCGSASVRITVIQ
jgi:hypothetical protein